MDTTTDELTDEQADQLTGGGEASAGDIANEDPSSGDESYNPYHGDIDDDEDEPEIVVACGYESQPVYDDEGYDQCGYDREGYDRNGYNREGYDRNGYDKKGYDQAGFNKEGFDRYGYDRSGYDHEGYDRKGYDHEGYDRYGYDCYGYDRNGFDREGYNRDGYDAQGCRKSDLSCGKAPVGTDPVAGAPEEGVLYFHPDYTGNISYTTDSVGTVKTRVVYMPYGDAIVLEGENNFRYKFNTHEQDKTGLQYFNARYYDPEVGRFAQADPTIPDPLNSQAFNRYMMCLGNPISYADVNGFQASTSPTYSGTVTTVNGGTVGAPGTMGTPSIEGGQKGEGTKGKGGANGSGGLSVDSDTEGSTKDGPSESDKGSGGMYDDKHSDSAPRYMAYGFGINSPSMAFSNLSAGAGIQSVHISNMNNSTDFTSGTFIDNKFRADSCALGMNTGGVYFFIALSKNLNVNDHISANVALNTWRGYAFSFSKGNMGNGNKGIFGKAFKSLSAISYIQQENWSGISVEIGGYGSISGMVKSKSYLMGKVKIPQILSKTNNQIGKDIMQNANGAKLSQQDFISDFGNLMRMSDEDRANVVRSMYGSMYY